MLTEYTCFGFYVTFQIIKPEIFCYLKTPNKILFLHNTIFLPLRQKIWRENQLFLAQIACTSVSAHFSSDPFRGGSCLLDDLSVRNVTRSTRVSDFTDCLSSTSVLVTESSVCRRVC